MKIKKSNNYPPTTNNNGTRQENESTEGIYRIINLIPLYIWIVWILLIHSTWNTPLLYHGAHQFVGSHVKNGGDSNNNGNGNGNGGIVVVGGKGDNGELPPPLYPLPDQDHHRSIPVAPSSMLLSNNNNNDNGDGGGRKGNHQEQLYNVHDSIKGDHHVIISTVTTSSSIIFIDFTWLSIIKSILMIILLIFSSIQLYYSLQQQSKLQLQIVSFKLNATEIADIQTTYKRRHSYIVKILFIVGSFIFILPFGYVSGINFYSIFDLLILSLKTIIFIALYIIYNEYVGLFEKNSLENKAAICLNNTLWILVVDVFFLVVVLLQMIFFFRIFSSQRTRKKIQQIIQHQPRSMDTMADIHITNTNTTAVGVADQYPLQQRVVNNNRPARTGRSVTKQRPSLTVQERRGAPSNNRSTTKTTSRRPAPLPPLQSFSSSPLNHGSNSTADFPELSDEQLVELQRRFDKRSNSGV